MSDPIYMLNALWFKAGGGKEKYLEYGAAVAPFLEKAGAEVQEIYKPEESLIGEWDPDAFFIVKYPSIEAFESMTSSAEHAAVSQLREEALEKSLLIRCAPYE